MDRLPVTVLGGPYCSRFTDYSIREILTDAKKSAEAHLAFFDRFKPDSLIVYNDIFLEAEAIDGCLNTAAEGGGYVLASGCEIPLNSTEDRVDHFFEYGRKSGRSFLAKLKETRPDMF